MRVRQQSKNGKTQCTGNTGTRGLPFCPKAGQIAASVYMREQMCMHALVDTKKRHA